VDLKKDSEKLYQPCNKKERKTKDETPKRKMQGRKKNEQLSLDLRKC